MKKFEVINLIKLAINLAKEKEHSPFTSEEYKAMYKLLDEIEKGPKKRSRKSSSDDWKGCQGTCDFEPQPNLTGWI